MKRNSARPMLIDKSQEFEQLMVARVRLTLALSGLLIIYIDPAEPDRLVAVTYATLVLYSVYSLLIYWLTQKRHPSIMSGSIWAFWMDLGWYALLISLSNGTNSLFFFGFLFAIIAASFSRGLRVGLLVSLISAVIFTAIGVVNYSHDLGFELNRFLIRPVYLLTLGYMIAYWGGFEAKLKRRLTLLKDISRLSNPRFGVDRTIGTILEKLKAFYQANSCLLVIKAPVTSGYKVYRTTDDGTEPTVIAEPLTEKQSSQLLALPDELIAAYNDFSGIWRVWKKSYYSSDVINQQPHSIIEEQCEILAAYFDCSSFITVPMNYRFESYGRIYITAQQAYDEEDANFLRQVVENFLPVIDNIRLIDHLASDAAEVERQRIATDIHDSVIQPYVGLKIGIAALKRKIDSDSPIASEDIDRLLKMTETGIKDLRQYISSLRSAGESDDGLISAIKRFISKFTEVTGIKVQVEVNNAIQVNDRLAAEILQMIAEGLSNIRRHTHSLSATISIKSQADVFRLEIENDFEKEAPWVAFTPRSIKARAESLGGRAIVKQNKEGNTLVLVEIPL